MLEKTSCAGWIIELKMMVTRREMRRKNRYRGIEEDLANATNRDVLFPAG
jgi:hypothetical protein